MLPTGFANTASDQPGLRSVITKIADWCESNYTLSALDPRRVLRETHVDADALTNALFFLVRKGVLQRVYKVQGPDGILLPGTYNDFGAIPDAVPNRFDDGTVPLEDSEVVVVFRRPE